MVIPAMLSTPTGNPLWLWLSRRIQLNRMELAGSFGDIGTDLPLLVGIILTAQMDSASVLIMFGLMQVSAAFTFGMPMPVQPLKAVAALVIAGGISAPLVLGAGLAIGLTMAVLSVTRLIDWLARAIPEEVIRGIQLGLGLKLATIALGDYVISDGLPGYVLAVVSAAIVLTMRKNRRFPAALIVIGLGVIYTLCTRLDIGVFAHSLGFSLPKLHVPAAGDMWQGFLLLGLAQLPLSLGNSILATQRLAKDYFPERPLSVTRISLSYSAINIITPFFSGMPVCHGSGGLAGHYAFGARTGGSALLYGLFYLTLGLFFSTGFAEIIQVFPLPMLGVILLFESIYLILTLRRVLDRRFGLFTTVLIGLMANGLPYGFLVALIAGWVMVATIRYWQGRKQGGAEAEAGKGPTGGITPP